MQCLSFVCKLKRALLIHTTYPSRGKSSKKITIVEYQGYSSKKKALCDVPNHKGKKECAALEPLAGHTQSGNPSLNLC